MKSFPLSSLPAHLQSQVVGQLHGGSPANAIPSPVEKPRLRQDTKGPNKTEREFEAHLRAEYPGREIHVQAVTLVLANGVRFTPDLFTPTLADGPTFWETKGHMRDDASVKIKVAARLHPWAKFYLATKRPKKKGGGWITERVLP